MPAPRHLGIVLAGLSALASTATLGEGATEDEPAKREFKRMKLELDIVRSSFDAGGSDDFDIGRGLQANFIYSPYSWLGLEAGFYVTEKVKDKVREDAVGQYQVSLDTSSFQLGVRPQYRFTQWQVYGRLGLLRYQTELEVEEFFGEGVSGGTDSEKTEGAGNYFGLGASYYATKSFTVQFELLRMNQPDLFAGRSDRAFDLAITNLSIGIGYEF